MDNQNPLINLLHRVTALEGVPYDTGKADAFLAEVLEDIRKRLSRRSAFRDGIVAQNYNKEHGVGKAECQFPPKFGVPGDHMRDFLSEMGYQIGRGAMSIPLVVCFIADSWRAIPPDEVGQAGLMSWAKSMRNDYGGIQEWPPEYRTQSVAVYVMSFDGRSYRLFIDYQDDGASRIASDNTFTDEGDDNNGMVTAILSGWYRGYIAATKEE